MKKGNDILRDGWESAAKQAHENGDDEMLMDICVTKYNVNELLKNISDDQIHQEINTGDSTGKEDW
jgi:hypothetical protein